ncbi:protein of unknown function [Modestobacter italicus]|uniref:Uncharacterized protein n=1 Tax=Modestobacter italicus (strain DSM 44449 / CECT 9708 / BC 501) TaxID=2732864 RepID=I4EYE9_MODI5|nr:protein of unknown function [Modestobacter marinus]
MTTARTATTAKDQRHDVCPASTPPSSGEIAAPAERKPAHSAMPRARACGSWVTAAMSASEAGNRAPAPRPLSAAPTQSTWTAGALAETIEPITRTRPPAACSRRRPKRSPSTPKVSSKTTTAIMNAAVIQVSCDPVVCSSVWNRPLSDAGMALATCATKTATQAAARVPATRAGRAVAGAPGASGRAAELVAMALSFESRLRRSLDRALSTRPCCGHGHGFSVHYVTESYNVSRKVCHGAVELAGLS